MARLQLRLAFVAIVLALMVMAGQSGFAQRVRLNGGAGGPQYFADGTAALPGIAFNNEKSTGLQRVSAGDVSLQVLGTSRVEAGATFADLKGADGTAYLRVNNAQVHTNSAALLFDLAGTAKFQFPIVGSTDGQMQFTNGAASTGIGWDVTTDGTVKLRNRSFTAGTGNLDVGAKVTAYNGVATVGWGVPSIVASGRSTAQTAAVASVAAYTVGAADGSFEASCNVLVTVATTHSFACTLTYTDEGNTSRTIQWDFATPTGFPGGAAAIVNTNGAIPYLGTVRHVRAKAATSITVATAGTFTTVTYNVEGIIKQVS